MYFEQVNAQGGICGRKVELVVRDHGYDVQKAVAGYSEMQSSVIGLAQFVGSPMVTALKQRITSDKMFVIPNAWATTLLGNKYIQVTGTTYDVDMINALDFSPRRRGSRRATSGHVYFEGDYGESALAGSKYAAGKLGLTLVEQKIKATDNDMTAQVSALKDAGGEGDPDERRAEAVGVLAGVARAKGIMVPIVASNSGFSPQLLDPGRARAAEGFYLASAYAPISSGLPAIKKLADDYGKKYLGQRARQRGRQRLHRRGGLHGRVEEGVRGQGPHPRGLITAHRATTAHDGGYGTPMDFSKVDEPGTRKTYILRTDAKALGGMVVERGRPESEAAETYQVPSGAQDSPSRCRAIRSRTARSSAELQLGGGVPRIRSASAAAARPASVAVTSLARRSAGLGSAPPGRGRPGRPPRRWRRGGR